MNLLQDLGMLSHLKSVLSHLRWYTVSNEFIQPGSDLTQFLGTLLLDNLIGCLLQIQLPIQLLYGLVSRVGVLSHLTSLHHQYCSSEVTVTFHSNSLSQLLWQTAALLLSNGGNNTADILEKCLDSQVFMSQVNNLILLTLSVTICDSRQQAKLT